MKGNGTDEWEAFWLCCGELAVTPCHGAEPNMILSHSESARLQQWLQSEGREAIPAFCRAGMRRRQNFVRTNAKICVVGAQFELAQETNEWEPGGSRIRSRQEVEARLDLNNCHRRCQG